MQDSYFCSELLITGYWRPSNKPYLQTRVSFDTKSLQFLNFAGEPPMQPVVVHCLWHFSLVGICRATTCDCFLFSFCHVLCHLYNFPFIVEGSDFCKKQPLFHLNLLFQRLRAPSSLSFSLCRIYSSSQGTLVSSCCTLSCLLMLLLHSTESSRDSVRSAKRKGNNHLLLYASQYSPGCV